ncbi:MAG: hypothetical protein IJD64_02905 [Clostridia bacterium]|nr:hypothetical protein [Clostridia bacterium]
MRGKKLLKNRFAVGLVCLLVAVYTLYHLIGLFDGELSTFAAGVTTEHTTLSYDGYFFRDETLLTAKGGGLADYAVSDGTKVSRGQTLATVYEGGADLQGRLRRIDSEIKLLEQSMDGLGGSTDPSKVKDSVNDSYGTLIKMLASGESGGLSSEVNQLLTGLNQMDTLWNGEQAAASKTLEALRAEREELLSSCGTGTSYSAKQSGYFYSSPDGFENTFTGAAIESLTGESFFDLIESSPASTANAYGKISYTSEWYLVIPVKPGEQKYFEDGGVYDVLFEENGRTSLPMTFEKSIEDSEQGVWLIVLSCDRLPEDFSLLRRQSVRITVDSTSGIYVPKDCVKKLDGMRGVYILRGSVVHFRQIDILYEGSDYYLVKSGLEGDGEVEYLQVNDLIILNGKQLFDGMVVN